MRYFLLEKDINMWKASRFCALALMTVIYASIIFATILIASAVAPLFPVCRDFFVAYLRAYVPSEGVIASAYHSRPMLSNKLSQLRLTSTLSAY
jgi:hypothetical protein